MNISEKLSSLRRSPDRKTGGRNTGPVILLAAFLVGMALLFLLVFGDRLRARVPVTAVPVLMLESRQQAAPESVPVESSGTMVAQASGWIEPDPFPILVPVKTDGFVEAVHVLEGALVETGQLLAELDPTNHMLRVQRVRAERDAARAALALQRQIVDMAGAEITRSAANTEAAEARTKEAADIADRVRSLTDLDVSPTERQAAERAETEKKAALAAARAEQRMAELKRSAEQEKAEQLEAVLARWNAELEQAEIDLGRTRIYSPINGRVLKRHAAPGMKRMAGMDDMNSSAIVTLYEPEHLQVRADVALSSIGLVYTGMPVRIVTAAFPGRVFTGVVSRITGEADITRNTLQVKASILDPDPGLRPEMLCRAEFIGGLERSSAVRSAGMRQLWIPEQAITFRPDGTAKVWVIDPVEQTAEQRDIIAGPERSGGLRLVLEGLRPGERVVTEGADRLTPGASVVIRKGNNP